MATIGFGKLKLLNDIHQEAIPRMRFRVLIGIMVLSSVLAASASAQQDPLDQGAADSTRVLLVRRSALAVLRRLLLKAVAGGYRGGHERLQAVM